MTSLRLIPACILLSFGVRPAGAAILAYEGFNTGTGGYLHSGGYADPALGNSNALVHGASSPGSGQNAPAFGFKNAWAGSAAQSAGVYARVENRQDLTYAAGGLSLATTTGQVSLFRTGSGSGTKSYTRSLDVEATNSHSTLYYSGMFSYSGSVMTSSMESGMGTTDYRWFRMSIATDGTLSLGGSTAGTVNSAAGAIVADQTYFFVWKITDGGGGSNDTMTLYLNPVSLSGEAGNSTFLQLTGGGFSVTNNPSFGLNKVVISGNPTDGQKFTFDELRIGSTWESVVPIPETSSAIMTVAAMAVFLGRRRR